MIKVASRAIRSIAMRVMVSGSPPTGGTFRYTHKVMEWVVPPYGRPHFEFYNCVGADYKKWISESWFKKDRLYPDKTTPENVAKYKEVNGHDYVRS